jgi:site-specific recombinase XerC
MTTESGVQSHDSGVRQHLQVIQEGLPPRQKLSMRKVTPNILRHSHAAKCADGIRAVPMIQKQVGQNRLSTT